MLLAVFIHTCIHTGMAAMHMWIVGRLIANWGAPFGKGRHISRNSSNCTWTLMSNHCQLDMVLKHPLYEHTTSGLAGKRPCLAKGMWLGSSI